MRPHTIRLGRGEASEQLEGSEAQVSAAIAEWALELEDGVAEVVEG